MTHSVRIKLRMYRETWRIFRAIFWALNRQDELKRLICWAGERNLTGPRDAYERHLENTQRQLRTYGYHAPRIMGWAVALQKLSKLIRSTPQYGSKGSATIYRHGNLDKSWNRPIVKYS